MLDNQGSKLDFWSGQGVKLKNSMGQDLDPGRGWKYRCLCSVTPLTGTPLWAAPSTKKYTDVRL